MGTILGTLLACCLLGVFLLWCLPAIFSAGEGPLFFLLASPLLSIGYGILTCLEAMRTNRCRGLILAALVPAFHLSWVMQQWTLYGSASD